MTKVRSFIAINLPPEVKDCLTKIITELKNLNPGPNVKWVNPEGLHFTLHFLGYLDEQQLEGVKMIVKQAVEKSLSVSVTLENLNGFPNLNWPRVLFVGCQEIGDSIIKKIQTQIGRQLDELGIETDKRPWQMHITLARLKIPVKIQIPNITVQKLNFKVESIDLMKSELSRQGAHYTIIESFPLLPSP